MAAPRQCERRDALLRESEEALRNGSDNLVLSIDHEIERTLGEKERALGALNEHRKAHGC